MVQVLKKVGPKDLHSHVVKGAENQTELEKIEKEQERKNESWKPEKKKKTHTRPHGGERGARGIRICQGVKIETELQKTRRNGGEQEEKVKADRKER